jgi:hypothetical protein
LPAGFPATFAIMSVIDGLYRRDASTGAAETRARVIARPAEAPMLTTKPAGCCPPDGARRMPNAVHKMPFTAVEGATIPCGLLAAND